jgi:hypothetical protein
LKSPHNQTSLDPDDKKIFSNFVNDYLKEDGVLALKLLSNNAHDLIVSEVVGNLFNLYKSKRNEQNQQISHQRTFKRQKIDTSDEDPNELNKIKLKNVKNINVNMQQFSETPLSTSFLISKPLPSS